jgi:hypothetical protein
MENYSYVVALGRDQCRVAVTGGCGAYLNPIDQRGRLVPRRWRSGSGTVGMHVSDPSDKRIFSSFTWVAVWCKLDTSSTIHVFWSLWALSTIMR